MRYLLPALVFAIFAAIVVLSPHVEPRRMRARAALVNADLRAAFHFIPGSHASWAGTRATGWPPFHYGEHREIVDELTGQIDGLPIRVAGYECVFAGSRHRYGLACVVLPEPADWAEVRGEPVFSAAKVPEHIPNGRQPGALPEFDRAYQLYAEESDAVLLVVGRATADAMLRAPEPFNWRTLDREALLWRRGGWSSAQALVDSVRIVTGILGTADAVSWR
jgi:hypothetical protein